MEVKQEVEEAQTPRLLRHLGSEECVMDRWTSRPSPGAGRMDDTLSLSSFTLVFLSADASVQRTNV